MKVSDIYDAEPSGNSQRYNGGLLCALMEAEHDLFTSRSRRGGHYGALLSVSRHFASGGVDEKARAIFV